MQDFLKKRGEFVKKLWEDKALLEEFKNNPKSIMEREMGIKVPDDMDVKVLEEEAGKHYFVVPQNPAELGLEISDQELEAVDGGCIFTATGVVLTVGIIVTSAADCV